MELGVQFQSLYHVQIKRLLVVIGIIGFVAVMNQLYVFPDESYASALSHASKGSVFVRVESTTLTNCSQSTCLGVVQKVVNDFLDSEDKSADETEREGMEKHYKFRSDDDKEMGNSVEMDKNGKSHKDVAFGRNLDFDKSVNDSSSTQEMGLEFQLGPTGHVKESNNLSKANTFSISGEVHNLSGIMSPRHLPTRIATSKIENLVAKSRTPVSSIAGKIFSPQNKTPLEETQSKDTNSELLQISASWSNNSFFAGNSIINKKGMKSTSISQMTILLLRGADESKSMKPHFSSPRDQEIQFARSQIENAPIIRDSPELYASLFRNVSIFKRSYELMERMLKVYIYKEGDMPIFHQPHLRGIYASEGWFMKLMEGNKQFVARDPRKAHLFYLPFSSLKLRSALHQESFAHQKDLENYLTNYTDIIAKKYRFWNKARGADHFLVACHDWAPRITRENMGNSIRALCNSNVAGGFRIGKDVSLPVTYIRSSQDPQNDLGGKPPSDRPIMAFFAGGIHGYVRPILLHYWENKEPDMKIFGPMPRDIEGKTKYREYMKSSKYCICARGYEVHTPRIVEAIYYGCVPVIISDNYVPPFFEVLDWEAFSVFVLEKDISNLRSVLLSVPEEKYLAMQQRVKMVQQHFLWHKKPVKYDLFHMILHSVWYNRVFQARL